MKAQIIGFIILLFFVGCKVEVVDPVPTTDSELTGVWNSYIYDPNYEYKSIILHLTQEGTNINGLGTYEDNISFDITSGNMVNDVVAFNFTLYDTNFGNVNGTFRGNYVNDEIHGHWQINLESKAYAIHFKPNNSIEWLPKYSHNQGGN